MLLEELYKIELFFNWPVIPAEAKRNTGISCFSKTVFPHARE